MEYIDIVDEQDRAESKWQISGSYAEKGYE